MRVELQIVAGPEMGRVLRLGARELVSVGRTDRADACLAADPKLSQVHFEVETDRQFCRLRDLNSANGTMVNGETVAEYVLQSGDKITAGGSTFLVKLEGGADPAELAAVRTSLSAVAAKAPPKVGGKKKVAVTVEDCFSGLKLFRGAVDDMQPGHVAELLGRKLPLYLMLDFHRFAEGVPAELEPPQYLLDWLPTTNQEAMSPIFVAYKDDPQGFERFAAAWGEDAIVGLFSQQDPVELRAHLRDQMRTNDQSLLGLCWPSVLSPYLSFFKPEATSKFMQGIEGVLVEFPDLPDTWQIYARPDFAGVLEAAGFEIITQPVAAADENKE